MGYVPNYSPSIHFARLSKLDEIKKLDPVAFEHFTASLFERMGYEVCTTPESGDEGVDLFITKNGRRAVVQCKRYENLVGQPVVRDLYGVMLHNQVDRAYLITTGHFSLPAQTWAEGKFIHLVDGMELCEWIGLVPPPPLQIHTPPPLPKLTRGNKKGLLITIALLLLFACSFIARFFQF